MNVFLDLLAPQINPSKTESAYFPQIRPVDSRE